MSVHLADLRRSEREREGYAEADLGARTTLARVSAPAQKFSLPDFKSVFLKLDIWGALKLSLVPSIIAILFTDLFDSISTFIGVAHAGGGVRGERF